MTDRDRMLTAFNSTMDYWQKYLTDPKYGPEREQILAQYLNSAPMESYSGANWYESMSIERLHTGVPVPRPMEDDSEPDYGPSTCSKSPDGLYVFRDFLVIGTTTLDLPKPVPDSTWLERRWIAIRWWLRCRQAEVRWMLDRSRIDW